MDQGRLGAAGVVQNCWKGSNKWTMTVFTAFYCLQVKKSNYKWKYAFAEQIHWLAFKSQEQFTALQWNKSYSSIKNS